MFDRRKPYAITCLVIASSLYALSCLSSGPAEAAKRDGTPYTYIDATFVTKSRSKARLDLIICLQGVAGSRLPKAGANIDKVLEEAAFACGAWANRVQPKPGEPDVQDLFDSIRECGFEPGEASPDADCGGSPQKAR